MNKNRTAKVLFLFALTYAALYLIGIYSPLREWGPIHSIFKFDYLYYLMPVVGFAALYLLPPWFNKHFETRLANSPIFPAAFFLISVAAYYVSLWWYFRNVADLAGVNEVPFDFIPLLLDSAFLVFVLAGIGGWLSRFIIERAERAPAEPQAEKV